jgi:hypothetical protein
VTNSYRGLAFQEDNVDPTKYAEHDDPEYDEKTAAGCKAAGEPVFLLRAQDVHAAETVRFWANSLPLLPLEEGGGFDVMALNAFSIANQMDAWPVKKEPDL